MFLGQGKALQRLLWDQAPALLAMELAATGLPQTKFCQEAHLSVRLKAVERI
jgi:hypothetical protein